MYWVAHYLQKGHQLNYLLSLNKLEKRFFIEAMEVTQREQIEYDKAKLKAITGSR